MFVTIFSQFRSCQLLSEDYLPIISGVIMSATLLSSLSIPELTDFFDSIDTVLIDCDGVIWLGDLVIQGAPEALDLLRDTGKNIFYVTNNSTKTREEFVVKCQQLGFSASKDEILCTAYLTGCYLSDLGFKGKVYVIGSRGLCKELDAFGIRHSDIGPENLNSSLGEYVDQFRRDPDISAVVVGLDEQYHYIKMMKAASYLSDPNCLFIATNTDETLPMKTDLVIPDTGSIISGIETCTDRKAFKIGKPSDFISGVLTKHHNIDPKRTLMIGDRGNTDILLGTRCGFKTLLVLTGVTNLDEVIMWQNSDDREMQNYVPDYYLNSLSDLLDLVKCVCSTAQKSSND